MAVFVVIGIVLVGAFLLWILYEVIQSAIDNSTLAKNVQDIRNHLIGKATEQETAASGEMSRLQSYGAEDGPCLWRLRICIKGLGLSHEQKIIFPHA
jgi:hypothetical protein